MWSNLDASSFEAAIQLENHTQVVAMLMADFDEAVGGEIGNAMLELLSPGGTLISYGALSGEPLVVRQPHLWMEAKKIRGFGMIHWTQLPYETRAADMAAATEFAQRSRHLIPLAGEFSLSEVTEAVRFFTRPGRDGAVLIRS